MKKAVRLIAAVLCIASSGAHAEDRKLTLADAKWLSGCWKAPEASRDDTYENWTSPISNAMLGLGATVKKGKVVAYEYMRIEAADAGDLVLHIKPFDKDETSFTLTSTTENNLVFENAKNAFPQRVIYRRQKDGSLEARIDGEKDGKKMAALFPMTKTNCQ